MEECFILASFPAPMNLKTFRFTNFPSPAPLQYFLSLYVLCLGRYFVALTQIKILVSSLTIVFCFTSIALFVQNVLVVFISECKAGLSRSLILVSRSTITIVSDEKNDLILQKIYVDDMVNLKIIHCKERTNNLTENI